MPLWLGGFDLTRLAEEKRELIMLLQTDAVAAFTSPFENNTQTRPQQRAKAPQPLSPLPPQDEATLTVPEAFRAVASYMEALARRMEREDHQRESRLADVEQENRELKLRLTKVEQENQTLEALLTARDRQQMDVVAWMTEKGHEMYLQAEQTRALTVRVDHLETPGSRLAEQQGGVSGPMPSPERLHALKTMPYEEYLQTPEWKATRKVALRRAWYRCQVCNNNKKPLYVHHRTYERRGCEEPEDLFVLCASCHANYDPQFAAKRQK